MENDPQSSALKRHNLSLNVARVLQHIVFHSYYNESLTFICYELMPFVEILKFTDNEKIVATIPRKWIFHASDFKDSKFVKFNIPPDTLFVEPQAISHLIIASRNETGKAFLQAIYDTSFRDIEKEKHQKKMKKQKDLEIEIKNLSTQLESLTVSHQSVSEDHKKVFEKHQSMLDIIMKGIKEASDTHSDLHKLFETIVSKIEV